MSEATTDDRVDASWLRKELWTRTYDWQADDVISGRVSGGAHLLWLALCRFSRDLERPATPRSNTLMKILGIQARELRKRFEELKEAGWVEVIVEHGAHFYGGRRRTTMLLDVRAGPNQTGGEGHGGPNPSGPSCAGGEVRSGPNSYPEEMEPEETDTHEGLPAQSVPGEEASKPQKRKAPTWVVALAQELLAIYPHGLKESGEVRRSTPKVVTERLRIALSRGDGQIKHDAEEIAGEMVRVARMLAEIPRTPEQRRFVQYLHVWINQAGWENPPEVGPKPRAPLQRGELPDVVTHRFSGRSPEEIRAERARIEAEKQVETPEEKAEREAEFLRRGRALASPVTSPVPDAATGPAGASQVKPADGLTDRQREARRRMGLPELGSAPPTTAAKAIERDKRRGGPPVPASVAGDVGALVGRIAPDPTAGGAT